MSSKNKVSVRVKPGSKKGPLVQTSLTGELLVFVREPAVEGRANKAVTELLAKYFEVPKNHVQIISGHKPKLKRFEIQS